MLVFPIFRVQKNDKHVPYKYKPLESNFGIGKSKYL